MGCDVSIILLTKNGEKRLKKIMQCITKQQFSGSVEIIAIDSGSEDQTLEILKDFNVSIYKIDPHEFHHSKTRNLGAEKSKGRVLVYLTQDALPINPYWLNNLINPLLIEKSVAVVYGRQIANIDAKIMDKFFYSYFYPNKKVLLYDRDIEDEKSFYLENIYISDVCSAIRRDIWEEIRFNDKVFMSEDKDFAINVLKSNHTILYEPNAIVYHSHNYTIKSLFKRRFKDGLAYSTICLEGSDNFLKKGFEFFKEEIKFIIVNKKIHLLPYAFIYNFIYFLGFQLGNKEKNIPKFIKKYIMEI